MGVVGGGDTAHGATAVPGSRVGAAEPPIDHMPCMMVSCTRTPGSRAQTTRRGRARARAPTAMAPASSPLAAPPCAPPSCSRGEACKHERRRRQLGGAAAVAGADRARARRAAGGRSGSRRGGAGAPPRRGRRRGHPSPLVEEVVARHSDPGTRVANAGSEHMHCVSGSGAAFERRARTFQLDEGLEEDVARHKTAAGHASRHESPAGGCAPVVAGHS